MNSAAYERWSAEIQAAQAEQELKEWVCDPRQSGLAHRIGKLCLKDPAGSFAEKREAERLAKREAIERQDMDDNHSWDRCASPVFCLLAQWRIYTT